MIGEVALESLKLTDAGKLVVTFGASHKKDIRISEEKLDSYIFLLNSDGVLPFSYSFRFEPLPYSQMLRDDAYNLVQAGYLGKASPLWITQSGLTWMQEWLSAQESGETLLSALGNALENYAKYDERALFKTVYARLASFKVKA